MRERLLAHWRDFSPHLKAAPLRFPLAFASAVAFSLVIIFRIHDLPLLDDNEVLKRCLSFFLIAFFLFLAGYLLGEARRWPRILTILLLLAAGGLLGWRILTADHQFFLFTGLNIFLAPASVLAVMAAPFVAARQGSDSMWHFNRIVWLGFAFGLLVGLMLGGGISGALWAMKVMFLLDVPNELYKDVWALSLGLVAPWLGLAAIPRGFEVPEAAAEPVPVPRPIAFLASYILVPLAIGYFALIYAFIVKIALLWELPKGEVAILIMGYAAFGVAAHLIAYPLREAGAWRLRNFHRWFYPALIVPAGLLALTIGVRVEAYGVTEDRYLVMAFAAWLLLLAPFMTLRPRTGLNAVPLSLAALLALGSFGPWGAESVSLASQMNRLTEVLTRTGILQDGRIVPAEEGVPQEDAVHISTIIGYLRRTGKEDTLAPWLEGRGLKLSDQPKTQEIVEAMGVPYVRRHVQIPTFRLHAPYKSHLIPIAGFEHMSRVALFSRSDKPWRKTLGPDADGESYTFRFHPKTGQLTVSAQDGASLDFDVKAYVTPLIKQGPNRAVEEFNLEARNDPLRVRLVFGRLNGTLSDSQAEFRGGDMLVLIDRTDR